MALEIEGDEAERLARRLSEMTGESITQAVVVALRERLAREQRRLGSGIRARVGDPADELAELPGLDDRSAEEIIGYDQYGLPT